MNRSGPASSGARAPRTARTATAAALTTTALTTAALVAAGAVVAPAQSVPTDQCPEAYPVSRLTDGQPVDGLTVSDGTVPEEFTGEVLGVLDDGIMPGLDMIIVRLTSPEIDRVGGIWSGMSGSPVYAADGRLIGAVSYGLSWGPSPVAGVTPAAAMHKLLSDDNDPNARLMAREVEIPDRMGREMVAEGDASSDEVESGLAILKLPFGITGLASKKRLAQVTKRLDQNPQLDLSGMRMMRVGTTAEAEPEPPVAGGNLAASLSYGDVTAAGIGTVTAVCGEEVIGFGHPMLWSGPANMTMHAADAVYVQEDPLFAGFKVANLGAPIGTISQDRMAGIGGALGAVPDTGQVTSTMAAGGEPRDGETLISERDWFSGLAFSHLLSNADAVFDGIGKGSGELGWTLTGTREDGSTFTVGREDVYADKYDLTFAATLDVYFDLLRLQYNGAEDVTFETLDADASMSRAFEHLTIEKVLVRRDGVFVRVREDRLLRLRAGREAVFKVIMSDSDGDTVTTKLRVPVWRWAVGQHGSLEVLGGNSSSSGDWWWFEEEGSGTESLDEVISSIQKAPHNDEVVATLSLFGGKEEGGVERTRKAALGSVVDGLVNATFKIVR